MSKLEFKITQGRIVLRNGTEILKGYTGCAKTGTMSYRILEKHNTSGNMEKLKIKFDCLASHDITFVNVIQTARASGLKKFPVPFTLTNCHNSLCAVGGTINADDHQFGLSAAKKYGGNFVPPHLAVIHQYMREEMAGCGKMILATDSHTRYGPLGTLAIGEGGGEIVKQLLGKPYDLNYPEIIAVKLVGKPRKGIGPMDVSLALISKVFASGFVKNKVLEFVGEGIANLSVDYRNGIDVMTTETTCLSSIWATDEKVRDYLKAHGRESEYCKLAPSEIAEYDGLIEIDLGKIEAMIAMPHHPSNALTIKEYIAKHGASRPVQAIVAGCAGGTYENITAFADILGDKAVTSEDLTFSIYPASQPILSCLTDKGFMGNLIKSGAIVRTAFCGPCFGAGDVPPNNGISIRHVTRNFENREGSKPKDGQSASVFLMDARSIAATVACGGVLTAATDVNFKESDSRYEYNPSIYKARVYKGFKKPQNIDLKFGPNIKDWPKFAEMKENILLKVCSVLRDEVTTTDELIPSGETSSYRSDPMKLSEFTLSRKDPGYLARTKDLSLPHNFKVDPATTNIGSVIVSNKPGDGSAREQAASCQRVLGGIANIAVSYATKRYRSNLINWGLVPFTISPEEMLKINVDDYVYIGNIKKAITSKADTIKAVLISKDTVRDIELRLGELTDQEREILIAGCLINYYKKGGN